MRREWDGRATSSLGPTAGNCTDALDYPVHHPGRAPVERPGSSVTNTRAFTPTTSAHAP
jgi:hypothetical protein